MMLTIASCLEVLERRRDLIAAAISSLRALEAADNPALALAREELQKPATPATAKPQAPTLQRPAPAPKAARAARETASSDTAVPGATPALRRHQDAILQVLLHANEPMASSAIAKASARSQTAVNTALAQLEKGGHVFRTGNGVATRWRLLKAKTDAAQPVQPTTPRTGGTPVRVGGVEFDTVFNGGRGQSLTGDRPSKGSGVPNV